MSRDAIKKLFQLTAAKRRTARLRRWTNQASFVIALTLTALLAFGTIAPVAAQTKAKAGKLTEEQKIIHLLNRMGYGPRPGDIERVKQMGINKYIGEQLHPERINDSAVEARLAGLDSLRMDIAQVYDKYPAPNVLARELGLQRPKQANPQAKPGEPNEIQAGSQAEDTEASKKEMRQLIRAYYAEHGLKQPQVLLQELQAQKVVRAVYSDRQLQEVMTDFWFNHFNIYWGKGADKWLTTDFEMNAIRPNALGKFKDLLMATAKSPAMLFYLDNYLSSSPNAKRPERMAQRAKMPRINDRFGFPPVGRRSVEREIRREQEQQQRELEREQMRAQHQQQQAANQKNKRQPGINENYARELMELHTLGVDGGYTQKDVQEVARCFTGWTIEQPRQSGKFVFRERMHDDGEKVVLGHKIPAGGGIKDAEMVIDILAHHPNTAKFISTKLVRRFVSDTPPPSLVDRVASVYMKTDGDIRDMLRTIFTSPEFNSLEAYRAKIKSPFELAVSAIRALGGDTNGSPRLAQFIAKIGEPLYQYQPPTGYPDRAAQWVNTGALLERLNFGLALSANRIPGTMIDLKRAAAGLDKMPSEQVMERAIDVLLSGDVSLQTRTVLDKQLSGVDSNAAQTLADSQVARAFGLVLGSPEFQRR